MEKIDFVVTWVDGNDPVWLKEKKQYEKQAGLETLQSEEANSECRYRDLGFLRYWFRSIEKFAPWVNKVFFITCGQKPDWLNTSHSNLVCINHRDYIPDKYLPTFNSNTIELNLHRIESLSEQFVLFNDDVFLLQPVSPEFFYHDGEPVLASSLRYPQNVDMNNWSRVAFNDYCLVNRSHNIAASIWKYRKKWFSVSSLTAHRALRNFLCYLANKSLPVGNYGHLAQPHLKSTLNVVWEKCPEALDRSSLHKFRSDEQVNQWLFCAWNQAMGKFSPTILNNRGGSLHINPENLDLICQVIMQQEVPLICLNDSPYTKDPEMCANRIASSFNQLFLERSTFELY